MAKFILENTGGVNSPYYSDLKKIIKPDNSLSTNGIAVNKPVQKYQRFVANGESFILPVADCPAASCQNSNPIAWNASLDDPEQQKVVNYTLEQYQQALQTEQKKGMFTVALVGAGVYAYGLSAPGFLVGSLGDASGQAYQSYTTTGEVDIRLEQSLFSGITGSVSMVGAGKLPAAGFKSVQGWLGLTGNATIGGVTAATNTANNNLYYDESTSLVEAGKLGAGFSGLGSIFGPYASNFARTNFPHLGSIPVSGKAPFIPMFGNANSVPIKIGNATSNTIGAIPAYIPLENGKNAPQPPKGANK